MKKKLIIQKTCKTIKKVQFQIICKKKEEINIKIINKGKILKIIALK